MSPTAHGLDRSHWSEELRGIYYDGARDEMAPFVPNGVRTLLDIGCGRGTFAAGVRARTGAECWGVELDEAAAQVAQRRLTRVLNLDIAKAIPELPTGYFDCIVFNDVLEHLIDPYATLRAIRPLLSARGVVVASLPNVRFFPVVYDLLWRGRWDYQDIGVLDRTHLRFFTLKTIHSLFTDQGFEAETQGINPLVQSRPLCFLVPSRFRDMLYQQFAVVARPI